MTSTAIILLTVSSILHALWNLISKSGKPSAVFFLILTLSTLCILLPVLPAHIPELVHLPARFWILLLGTGFFQSLYYTGLAMAYRSGDVSLVYPLIRALPVLLIPLVCSVFNIGTPLSLPALSGLMLVGAGCVLIPLKSFRTVGFRDYLHPSLLWVLPGAAGTAGYTLIDSIALGILETAPLSTAPSLIYTVLLNLAIVPWLLLFIGLSGSWGDFADFRGKKILSPLTAGIALCGAYMLVLASMTRVSNVSYVAGFRQMSIPLGVLLAVTILKEKAYPPRIAACLILSAGLVLTALY